MTDALNLVSKFQINGTVDSVKPFGNGHINRTFVVNAVTLCGQPKRYILQGVNKNVFPNGEGLMANIVKVTSYLRPKAEDPRGVMTLIPTKEGSYFIVDDEGFFWRVFDFIEDSVCIERVENLEDFYECARGFGDFQRQLKDFPVDTLVEVIPDFHNTPKRFETFKKAVAEDVCGRAASVKDEIEFFMSEADFYPVLYDNLAAGVLPLRVTHNDTKTNNIMLDAKNRKALCVIDLDTIMPGFSVTDFGDAIRFGANTAAEDEKDLSKVSLSLELFEVYTKGFLAGLAGELPEAETMLLPEGAKMMTIECGMRFLTDYLQGDTYFKTSYEGHNLDRARTQIELVRDMNRKWADMKAIVKKYL
ncbi:MAG: aminoglycoside phosphotransferase family protein [Acutalibacteraceae bacterium]|nr:aminoglycoside phosphotransferase family protein [Acutalibacteraceae bacterium]